MTYTYKNEHYGPFDWKDRNQSEKHLILVRSLKKREAIWWEIPNIFFIFQWNFLLTTVQRIGFHEKMTK